MNDETGGLTAGMLALLTAEPPASLLGLALRWIPVDTAQACRIAAMGCAVLRSGIDLTVKHPADEPAAETAEIFREWLLDTSDTSAAETALRVYCLHFACLMTPQETAPGNTVKAAGMLRNWFAGGKLRRSRFGT